MKIHGTLSGAFRRNREVSTFTLAVVRKALGSLEKLERYFICLLNEEQVALDREVHVADKLKVLLPVGGG